MKKFNPAHAEVVKRLLADSPFYQTIGFDVVEISEGYCRVDLEITKKHHNPFGRIHGGVMASLLDVATYWAQYAEAPENGGYVTLDLLLNDMHNEHLGKVICEAHAMRSGHHVLLSEGTLKSDDGTLLVAATSKLYSSPKIVPVIDILQKFEPNTVIPPKYIEAD